MKIITLLATATIAESSLKQLGEFYNEYAEVLGKPTVKKFRDKATGMKRLDEIQKEYADALSEFQKEQEKAEKAEKKPAKEKAEKTGNGKYSPWTLLSPAKTDYEPKEDSINEFIMDAVALTDGMSYVEMVDLILAEFKRPNGALVTTTFAKTSINWLIAKGYIIA